MDKKEILNGAINKHKVWIKNFRDVYLVKDIDFLKKNIHLIKDNSVCELGKWLNDAEETKTLKNTLNVFVILHDTFHNVAEILSSKIIDGSDEDEIREYIYEIENISSQLIELIELEKASQIDFIK